MYSRPFDASPESFELLLMRLISLLSGLLFEAPSILLQS
jgi:hypothetical protein